MPATYLHPSGFLVVTDAGLVTVTGTLDVTGAVTLDSTLSVGGIAAFLNAIRLTDPDVAHTITLFGITTDTLAQLSAISGASGGLFLWGISDDAAVSGMVIYAVVGSATPSAAALELVAGKKNGATTQAIGAAEVAIRLRNGSAGGVVGTIFLDIYGDGRANFLGAVDIDTTLNVDGAVTFNAATTVKPGTAADTAKVGGILFTSTTTVGNVGTGDDDLLNYSVPANTLSANNQSIWFKSSGKCANNANTKRLRVKFGTTSAFLVLDWDRFDINKAIDWALEVHIYRTGAATQKAHAELHVHNFDGPTNGGRVLISTLDQTLSGAVALRITGEATSNNDITLETVKIGWDGENT